MASMVEEFEARADKIKALEAQCEESANEVAGIMSERDDLTEEVAAMAAEKEELVKAHDAIVAQLQEVIEANTAKQEEDSKIVAEQAEKIEKLEGELALAPHSDVVEGQEAVEIGAKGATEEVDHWAIYGAKETPTERAAYYKEHRAAMDASHK